MAGSSDDNARAGDRTSDVDLRAAIGEEVHRVLREMLPELLEELRNGSESTPDMTSGPSVGQPISYKQFKHCDPPRFEGKKDVGVDADYEVV